MNVFRKIVLACLATVAVMGPAMLPTQFQPSGSVVQAGKTRYYYVYYRPSPHYSWTCLGYTSSLNEAVYYTNLLRSWGYESFYR